jgi:signal transduction histidine kinase
MKPGADLARRLGRPFLLQAAAITLVALLGVFATAHVLENQLMREALRAEADFFWARLEADPAIAPPHTKNLHAFLLPPDTEPDLPRWLRKLQPGYHALPAEANHAVGLVTRRGERTLVLVFDMEEVRDIAIYFGLFPLAGLLVLLYLSSWLALRASLRVVSPITRLTRAVQALDIEKPDAAAFRALSNLRSAEHEVSVLAGALAALVERIDAFVAREREFTRDASHELRTPLAVMKLAGLILREDPATPPHQINELARVSRAVARMEELVETFLVLAREGHGALPPDEVALGSVVAGEIELCSALLGDKPISVSLTRVSDPPLSAPVGIVKVLVGNLLRNAFTHTRAGYVRVHVDSAELVIEDSGPGMSLEQIARATDLFYRGAGGAGGHGIGLSVVKRLCDRYGWQLSMHSKAGHGTCVVVRFAPAA